MKPPNRPAVRIYDDCDVEPLGIACSAGLCHREWGSVVLNCAGRSVAIYGTTDQKLMERVFRSENPVTISHLGGTKLPTPVRMSDAVFGFIGFWVGLAALGYGTGNSTAALIGSAIFTVVAIHGLRSVTRSIGSTLGVYPSSAERGVPTVKVSEDRSISTIERLVDLLDRMALSCKSMDEGFRTRILDSVLEIVCSDPETAHEKVAKIEERVMLVAKERLELEGKYQPEEVSVVPTLLELTHADTVAIDTLQFLDGEHRILKELNEEFDS